MRGDLGLSLIFATRLAMVSEDCFFPVGYSLIFRRYSGSSHLFFPASLCFLRHSTYFTGSFGVGICRYLNLFIHSIKAITASRFLVRNIRFRLSTSMAVPFWVIFFLELRPFWITLVTKRFFKIEFLHKLSTPNTICLFTNYRIYDFCEQSFSGGFFGFIDRFWRSLGE